MKNFIFILIVPFNLLGCAHLLGAKPVMGLAQGKRPTINLTRRPDSLYDTLTEMRKIKREEFYLDKEHECWERTFTYSREYQHCIIRKSRKRKEARRYIKRDQFVELPGITPAQYKYINVQ